ncbi:hypothetical protein Smic_82560 [Streptomyces microflavus]|uniref:Uncharacterized protein n=1 Tax=Streptomyces microflavus TaxID=1919 RepID=A0A7J0D4P8_STRMI|nr:hypothetical protein Smic_82560 [Streptomyces microflavus]
MAAAGTRQGQGEGRVDGRHHHRHPGPPRLHRADRFHRPGPYPAPDRRPTPQYAARLFDAQEQGAGDARLQEIAAEALKDVYFQDGGTRAGSLDEVRFTDIEHLEFDL